METFHVGGTWVSPAPFDGETLSEMAAQFSPSDESFCFWVDSKDPRRLEMSWDEDASSLEEAARRCKGTLDLLLPVLRGRARLSEVSVSTDEGYWETTDPEAVLPSEF